MNCSGRVVRVKENQYPKPSTTIKKVHINSVTPMKKTKTKKQFQSIVQIIQGLPGPYNFTYSIYVVHAPGLYFLHTHSGRHPRESYLRGCTPTLVVHGFLRHLMMRPSHAPEGLELVERGGETPWRASCAVERGRRQQKQFAENMTTRTRKPTPTSLRRDLSTGKHVRTY